MIETARGTFHMWQCDHMGHVNVRAYGEKFEEACWQLYAQIGATPTRFRAGEFTMAAVQQNITYRKELLAGDVVAVHSGFLEVRDRVVRFVHELSNVETGDVCALSEFTVVCVDSRTRRARMFPPEIAQRARELLIDFERPQP